MHLVGSVRSDTQTHLAGKRRVTKKRCSVESVWLAGASRGVMQVYHDPQIVKIADLCMFGGHVCLFDQTKQTIKKTVQVSTKQVKNRCFNLLFLQTEILINYIWGLF